MLIYDETDDRCTKRVAKLWSRLDYFPGAVPSKSIPPRIFNITEYEMKNNILYIENDQIYSEYNGISILYRQQKSTIRAMLGHLRGMFPFNILGKAVHEALRANSINRKGNGNV